MKLLPLLLVASALASEAYGKSSGVLFSSVGKLLTRRQH